jgi:hypothetical protein
MITAVTLPLNIGAARLLQSLFVSFGATEPGHVFLIGMFSEEKLSVLPEPPAEAVNSLAMREFNRREFPVEASVRTVEAIKSVIKTAVAKGGIPGSYEAAVLLKAVDLTGA